MADEKLIIDVSVRDELTPALQKADKAVGNFATTAKAGFDRVDDSASKLSAGVSNAGASIDATKKKAIDFADAARQKFEALGKAAIGIFAADVLAKALGFSSALDAISKASEVVAGSISSAAKEVLGLGAAYEQAQRAALRFDEAVIRARENREKGQVSKSLSFQSASGAKQGVNLDLSPFLSLPGDQFDAAALAFAQVEAELTAVGNQINNALNAAQPLGQFDISDPQKLSELQSQFNAIVSQIDRRVIDAVNAAARSSAQKAALSVGQVFGPEAPAAFDIPRGFQFIEPRFSAGSEQFGPPSPEAFNLPSNFQFIPGGGGSSRGSGSTFSAEFNAANARRRAVAGRVAQNRRRDQSQFLPLEFTEAVQQTQQIASFAEQAAQSFDNLGNAIRSSIGDQVVLGSFNALSNFFAQAIQGQATLRDLGRSFVQLGAQILAQQAALRVLGFFGFGGAAAGAGVGAAGSAGVAAGGAAGSISLGSGGFSTLGIQGGGQSFAASRGAGIQVSLSVTSLDPRGAADVVLSQMPVIQRALASSISNGSSRALRVAVGNA